MAVAEEFVDTSVPPSDAASRRRGRVLRLLVPPVLALVLVLAVVGITLHTARLNREDALRLTGELIATLETSIRREVQAFLAPTRAVISFLADMAGTGIAGDPQHDAELERVLRQLMWRTMPFAGMFIGDDEGDFVMVQRAGPDQLVSKFVTNATAPRTVRLVTHTADGRVLDDRVDPTDAFDPRARPWFAGAAAADTIQFSEAYRFFSSKELGITASLRVPPAATGVPVTVVGVDVQLTEVGRFLDRIDLGPEGRLVMIQGDGRIIAARSDTPGLDRATVDDDGSMRVVDLADPVLNRVYQRFRIGREEAAVVEIGDRSFVVAASPLADLVGRDWWLFLAVPESRFVGFIAENAQQALWLSLVVLGLAALAAGLVTYQGVQADRQTAAARAAEATARAQGRALESLGSIGGLPDPTNADALRALTRIGAQGLGARRLGVWRLDPGPQRLVSLDVFDAEAGAHSTASALPAAHLGDHWQRLLAAERFTVDVRTEPTSDLVRYYLAPAGARRLDSVPIRSHRGALGAVWIEDATALSGAVPTGGGVCAVIAGLLVPRLEAQERLGTVQPTAAAGDLASALPAARDALDEVPDAALRRSGIAARRDTQLLTEIARRPGGQERLGGRLFPRLAVLELRIGDDIGLAARTSDGGSVAMERIVDLARGTAEGLGVRYLKLLGDTVVAADGFDRPPDAATIAVAELALGLQRGCREILADVGGNPSFRLGIDLAPGIAAPVGFSDPDFNLWGEAVTHAAALAATAPSGAIQVSATVYEALNARYLLRRRGGFFMRGVGMTDSYVLLGEL